MKKGIFILLSVSIILSFWADQVSKPEGELIPGHIEFPSHMLEKISYRDVTITDNFWRPKIVINRVVGIRHALQQVAQSIEDFDIAAGKIEGEHHGKLASDSDVYKIIQGAAYALHHTPDGELEAAIDSVFGPEKRHVAPWHEEIELALYTLYEISGERRYLDLSIFFIDERGNPERIADALIPPEHDPKANTPFRWRLPSYMQDHLPVTEQFNAIGHAVCATYLYSSMADISMETKDAKYLPALDSIWSDIVSKKLYVTGGVGSREFHDEGFGSDYLLQNDQAYCETCANIAMTFWNRRMNLLHGDAKYADLLELIMYNSGISGVSLNGDRFFYTNPLESEGNHRRQAWDDPPCCATNMVRFLPEIGSTIYRKTDNEIYINQFIGSEVKISLTDNDVNVIQESNYPWDGGQA